MAKSSGGVSAVTVTGSGLGVRRTRSGRLRSSRRQPTAALLVLAGGELLNGTSAALVFMTATMVFALGETLQGPTQAPLVADLAPDHLRGRYFALGSMSWSAGSILGPAVGGPLLGWHPLAVWPLAAAVCVGSALGCLALERRLPTGVRRTPKPEAVPVTPLIPPLDLAAERL